MKVVIIKSLTVAQKKAVEREAEQYGHDAGHILWNKFQKSRNDRVVHENLDGDFFRG